MIYFLRSGEGGPVKIGFTKNAVTLKSRIYALQNAHYARLSLIRTIEANKAAETWLHNFFSGVRGVGEWFGFLDDMLTVMPPHETLNPEPLAAIPPTIYPHIEITPDHCRAARACLDLTQADLAKLAGMNKDSIMKFEMGKKAIRPNNMAAIAHVLMERGVDFLFDPPGLCFERWSMLRQDPPCV